MTETPCPCGSKKTYSDCCGAIHRGNKDAETAEQLMRSRYTAFTTANINYLMLSHHSKTRPIKDKKNIEQWAKSVQWMGLTIINTEAGLANDRRGYVEFSALFAENGKLDEIHEKSLFERENEKWVYVSGVHF